MADKLIMTIDLDAFFASSEELRHPEVKEKPMVVSHELGGRGVILSPNYLARGFGIHSGMPLFKAKKLCPELNVVNPDFEFYQTKANEVFGIINSYSEKMEVASIDECFVDVTNLTKKYEPIEIAKMIQKDIFNKTGLWTSVGISTDLLLSKMASSMDKPQGVTTLWRHELPTKLWTKPIGDLYMVGRKTSEYFINNEISTIGDLANLYNNQPLYKRIRRHIGINLDKLIAEANGNSKREVDPERKDLKSLSKDETFSTSLLHIEELRKETKRLLKYAFERAEIRKLNANSISVSIKEDKSFQRVSASKSFPREKFSWDEVWGIAETLLDKLFIDGMSVKFISVGFSGLKPGERTYKQLSFDEQKNEEVNKLQEIIDNASSVIHQDVFLGSTMNDNKRYNKKNHLDDDRVKFKSWDK